MSSNVTSGVDLETGVRDRSLGFATTLPASGRPPGWRWESRGRLREVFWISSGGERLYGSLCTAARPDMGVVIMPGWARDGRLHLEWSHRLALQLARRGGCGLLVQWPGHEDSEGDADTLTLDRMVEVALDAVEAARRRFPVTRWSLAGIRLGGTIAALAADRAEVERCVLMQPDLDIDAYFAAVARYARLRMLRGDPHPGWGFGHPVSDGLHPPDAGSRVQTALAHLRCPTSVIRYTFPVPEPLPSHFLDVRIQGSYWSPPGADHRLLRQRALELLTDPRATRR